MSEPQTAYSEKIGDQGDEQTITVESFDTMPSPPDGAKDITTSLEDGRFVLRYTIVIGGVTTYTITGGVSQEPLATHPMFQSGGDYEVSADEWKKWKIWESDPHDVELNGWKPDDDGNSDGMKKYYEYRNRGVDDFLLGTVTMRVTETDTNQPSLSGLGSIQTPPGAPPLENGRNWLLVGIDGERVADQSWKTSREYRASRAGGWDSLIYAKT